MKRIIIIVEINVVLIKCELIGELVPTIKYWIVMNTHRCYIRYCVIGVYVELELI